MNTDAPAQRADILPRMLAAGSAVIVAALIYLYRPEEGSANVLGGWIFLLAWGLATMTLVQRTGSKISGEGRSGTKRSDLPGVQFLAYGVLIGLLVASIAAESGFGIGIEPEMLCWPILIAFGVPALFKLFRRDKATAPKAGEARPAAVPPA